LRIDAILRCALAAVLLAYAVYLAIYAYPEAPSLIGPADVLIVGFVCYQLYGLKNDYRIWLCKKCHFRFYYKNVPDE